jgi:PKD repeat protein/RNA polymerase subunit RPABC4/transcription elongation factor Spt4
MILKINNIYSKLILAFLAFSLVAFSVQPVFAQLWTTKSSMSTPRGQVVVVLDQYGLIYVIGGYAGGASYTTVEAYDPITNTWVTKAPLPVAIRGACGTMGVDGKIYVFGGLQSISTTQIYDPATDTWSLGTNMPTNQWAAGAAAAPNGLIYVIGGESDPNAVQIYKPAADTWSSGTPMPSARLEHVVVLGSDGLIYAIGGIDTSKALVLAVEAYNPNTNTWATKAPLPAGRVWMGVTTGLTTTYVIGGGDGSTHLTINEEASRLDPSKIYVFGGGTQYGNNDPPVYRNTYIYNPTTNSWTTGASTSTPRREHGAATLPITKLWSNLNISLSHTTANVGDTITIEGFLSPAYPSAPISIQWRINGGSWNTLTTVNTNMAGGYTTTWELEEGGEFEFKATWLGDDFTLKSESTVKPLIAEPVNVPPLADAVGPYSGMVGDAIAFSSSGSSDSDGSIAEYRWDFDDGSGYTYTQNPSHTYTEAGTYTVSLQVTDDEGATHTDTAQCTVSEEGLPLIPIVAGVGAAAAVVAFFLLRRKPKEEALRPSALRITVEPPELPADGKSTSTITIELLDKKGEAIQASEEVEVRVSTTLGKVTSPITISEGVAAGKAILTSSTEFGETRVSAESRGLRGARTSFEFVEKKRYCMHCGTRMPLDINRCPNCGRGPPSGVDVKACPNCGEIIPTVARFCSACGASQT